MKRRFLTFIFLLALILLLSTSALAADAAPASTTVASGYCGGEADGKNLTWTLDSNGTLIISGSGAMADYTSSGNVPWYNYSYRIKKVVIEDGVSSVGNHAFQDSDLTTLVLPQSLKSIGDHTFDRCYYLNTLVLPQSLKSIGDYAFTYCDNLYSIALPEGLVSIGDSAFECCHSLSIHIPSNVQEIGVGAFCETRSITLSPDSKYFCVEKGLLMTADKTVVLTQTDYSALVIIVPDTVREIYSKAFTSPALSEIYLPEGITELPEYTCCNYDGTDTNLVINLPNTLQTIHDNAFYGVYFRDSITIPASVTKIGKAFPGCRLSSIYFLGNAPDFPIKSSDDGIPDDATLYYTDSASGWSSPTWKGHPTAVWTGDPDDISVSWTLVNGVLTINGEGKLLFDDEAPWWYYRDSITNVVVSEGITSLGYKALWDLDKMRTLSLPSTYEERFTASDYPALRKITVASGARSIASYNGAIYSSDMKTLISVPPAMTGTFVIPNGVTTIESGAFLNCASLTEISVPSSVSSWAWYHSSLFSADYGCTSLLRFSVSANNEIFSSVDGVLFSKDKTELLWFPAGKTGSYSIPEGTKETEYCSFLSSSLSELNIPSSLTSISLGSTLRGNGGKPSLSYFSFYGCENLRAVNVAPGNTEYCSVGGVLYSKDMTRVLIIPNSQTEYTFPDSLTSYTQYSEAYGTRVLHLGENAKNVNFSAFPVLEQVSVHEDNLNYYVMDGVVYSRDLKTLYWCPRNYSGVFTVPESVTSIGGYAFRNCTGISGLVLPGGPTNIGQHAFEGCTSLTEISLNGGSVSEAAFSDCTSLKKVTLDNVYLDPYAFYKCSELSELIISANCSTSSNTFALCTSLEQAIFVGDPPIRFSRGTFSRTTENFSICYTGSSISWPAVFCGYPTEKMSGCLNDQHTPVTDPASAPTCTEDGLTEGSHCSACGEVLLAQETVPATGHSYSSAAFTWSEDLRSAEASALCHCGHEENASCLLVWDNSTPCKLVVSASAIFGEDGFSDSREITASINGNSVSLNMPTGLGSFTALAASYSTQGRMLCCITPEINGSTIGFTLIGSDIRIFFFTENNRALYPSMRIS